MKSRYDSRYEEGGTFLGTIRTLKGTDIDIWICDDILGKTLVLRYGDRADQYSSSALPVLKETDGSVSKTDEYRSLALGLMITMEIMKN